MVKVKICGITSYRDAALAVDSGADALGFNFYTKSPRYIRPEEAVEIIRRLPPFVVMVGIFVNESTPNEVIRKAKIAGIHCLQLHGNESPQFCNELRPWSVIKSFRLKPDFDLNVLDSCSASAFLLDAYDEKQLGGTGRTTNWELAIKAKKFGKIILAGGLNSSNIASAIKLVEPYAVDVCSGVEREPGKKDRALLQAFINEVERARKEIGKQ